MRTATLGNLRARRAERKRGEILRAGLKVFAEKGFRAATMDDIALELEATKGLLYYHFRTKEDLLRAILEGNPLSDGIERIFADVAGMRLEEALSTLADRFVRLVGEHADLVRFLHVQALLSEAEADVVYTSVLERLYRRGADVFEGFRRRGEIRESVDPLDLARSVADLLIAHVIQGQIFGPDRQAGPRFLEQVADVWVRGIAAPRREPRSSHRKEPNR